MNSRRFLLLLSCFAVLANTGCRKWFGRGGAPAGSEMDSIYGGELTDALPEGRELFSPERRVRDAQFESVYFGYDSAQITPSEAGKMTPVVDFMTRRSTVALVVEGHCDERGSAEYNLALGERRALAARAYLIGLGVDAGRIHTRSFGEEQPVAMGHDESAWRLNRRAEFALYE